METGTAPQGTAEAQECADGLPSFDVFAADCPARVTLEHITGRWGVLALGGLANGPLRFNELGRRIDGVSQKMLAQTLQALERDGFVEREVLGTIPPHVVYRLSPAGAAIGTRVTDLIADLEALMPQVLTSRSRYDLRADRG